MPVSNITKMVSAFLAAGSSRRRCPGMCGSANNAAGRQRQDGFFVSSQALTQQKLPIIIFPQHSFVWGTARRRSKSKEKKPLTRTHTESKTRDYSVHLPKSRIFLWDEGKRKPLYTVYCPSYTPFFGLSYIPIYRFQ